MGKKRRRFSGVLKAKVALAGGPSGFDPETGRPMPERLAFDPRSATDRHAQTARPVGRKWKGAGSCLP